MENYLSILKEEKKMTILRHAVASEVEKCYHIIDEGRKFQKEQGFTQWTDDYPNFQTIQDDIKEKKGYVIEEDKQIAGYMCIDFGGEPAYLNIDGEWRSNEKYAVVHRMAFDSKFRGKGLSSKAWELISKYCLEKNVPYIRVDTDFPNKRMQHILEKNGFVKCGVIIFQGSGKIAYDKILK